MADSSHVKVLRSLGARPWLLPLTALLLRARVVRPTSLFLARESLLRRKSAVYRLRSNGLRVTLRHGTGDVVTLGEVFHDYQYLPGAEVERALGQVRQVIDLGANIGLFGAFAAGRWPEAEILAFEPDPENAAVHERTIALNRMGQRWRLVRAAAGASPSLAQFASGQAALSHVAGPHGDGQAEPGIQTIEVEVRDVLPMLAGADLLKMDIEGGEWAILGDERFRASPPRAVVLEYHPRFCPSDDPRTAVEDALRAAGLVVQTIWHRADGHGMLWAWRP